MSNSTLSVSVSGKEGRNLTYIVLLENDSQCVCVCLWCVQAEKLLKEDFYILHARQCAVCSFCKEEGRRRTSMVCEQKRKEKKNYGDKRKRTH